MRSEAFSAVKIGYTTSQIRKRRLEYFKAVTPNLYSDKLTE